MPFQRSRQTKCFGLVKKWWTEQTELASDAGCERIAPILKEYTNAGLSNFENVRWCAYHTESGTFQ